MTVRMTQALQRESLSHGAWYLGYECQCCGAKIPIRADDSEGEAALGRFRLGLVSLLCPHCGSTGQYDDRRLLRFRYLASPSPFSMPPFPRSEPGARP